MVKIYFKGKRFGKAGIYIANNELTKSYFYVAFDEESIEFQYRGYSVLWTLPWKRRQGSPIFVSFNLRPLGFRTLKDLYKAEKEIEEMLNNIKIITTKEKLHV
jgi:hypothetical protein